MFKGLDNISNDMKNAPWRYTPWFRMLFKKLHKWSNRSFFNSDSIEFEIEGHI